MSRFDCNGLWPLAAAVSTAVLPAQIVVASSFLTTDAAQRALFPAAQAFDELKLVPSAEQLKKNAGAAGPQAPHGMLRAWTARQAGRILGYVFVDEVVGREDFITYAVGIDTQGRLR